MSNCDAASLSRIANTASRRQHLAGCRGHQRVRQRRLDAADDPRHARRRDDLLELLRRVDPISSTCAIRSSIHRRRAGERVEEHQEEHDDRHQHDLRQHVEAEEHDEQRRQCDQRHAVERHHDRPQDTGGDRGPAEHQSGEHAEGRTDHQTGDHLGHCRRDVDVDLALQPRRQADRDQARPAGPFGTGQPADRLPAAEQQYTHRDLPRMIGSMRRITCPGCPSPLLARGRRRRPDRRSRAWALSQSGSPSSRCYPPAPGR